ncbi:MAG: MFS transporter [Myxococcales bacterium]|nr:MFS transporter [Myxococcales bacterium]
MATSGAAREAASLARGRRRDRDRRLRSGRGSARSERGWRRRVGLHERGRCKPRREDGSARRRRRGRSSGRDADRSRRKRRRRGAGHRQAPRGRALGEGRHASARAHAHLRPHSVSGRALRGTCEPAARHRRRDDHALRAVGHRESPGSERSREASVPRRLRLESPRRAGERRRRILAGSEFGFAVCALLIVLSVSFETLVVVRTALAVVAGTYTGPAMATAAMIAPYGKRGRYMQVISMGQAIAALAGVPLGAWIAAQFGWRVVYVMLAIMAGLAATALYLRLPRGMLGDTLSIRDRLKVLRNPGVGRALSPRQTLARARACSRAPTTSSTSSVTAARSTHRRDRYRRRSARGAVHHRARSIAQAKTARGGRTRSTTRTRGRTACGASRTSFASRIVSTRASRTTQDATRTTSSSSRPMHRRLTQAHRRRFDARTHVRPASRVRARRARCGGGSTRARARHASTGSHGRATASSSA